MGDIYESLVQAEGKTFRCPHLQNRISRVRCCLRQHGLDPLLADEIGRFKVNPQLEKCEECALGLRILAHELNPPPNTSKAIAAEKVPEVVAAILSSKEITQADLAKMLGVSGSAVTHWIHGRWVPKLPILHRLGVLYEASQSERVENN